MLLDLPAVGGRSPVQTSVMARIEAMLPRVGSGLIALAFLLMTHLGPTSALADTGPRTGTLAHSAVALAAAPDMSAGQPAAASRPIVETIRRMSRALPLRTTDTQFAAMAESPAIPAEIFADTPRAALPNSMTGTRGSGVPARAPPSTTYIL